MILKFAGNMYEIISHGEIVERGFAVPNEYGVWVDGELVATVTLSPASVWSIVTYTNIYEVDEWKSEIDMIPVNLD